MEKKRISIIRGKERKVSFDFLGAFLPFSQIFT